MMPQEMEDEIAQDRKSLARLFARIDLDGSGQLTLDELIEGAQRDSDFQSRLRVMDIDESETWAILGWDMTEGRSTEPQPPAKGTASSWL
eukprot:g20693.t1